MSQKPFVSTAKKLTVPSNPEEEYPGDEEEVFSKQVRIVVTSSSDKGGLRGSHQTLVNMSEGDNRSDGGESMTNNQAAKTEEPKSRGWFSFLGSSKKEADNGDAEEIPELPLQDDATFDADDDKDRYNVNGLRVPSLTDDGKARGENPEDDDSILRDPYGDIRPDNENEPMMKDEEQDEYEDHQIERRRFFMCLTSKTLFLIGSMLFLVLAAKDYQRIKRGALPVEATFAPTMSVDDDFVYDAVDVTELEEEMELAAARKDERAGSAITTLNGDSRRRAQGLHRRAATNWYTQYWAGLPEEVKEGAKLLGYDQPNWDAGSSVYTDRLHWDELTPEQQEAAYLVFGYEEDTWNDYVDRFLANTPAPATASPTDPAVGGGLDTEETGEVQDEVNEEISDSEGDVDNSSQGYGGETGDVVDTTEGDIEPTGDTAEAGDQGSDGSDEVESTTPVEAGEEGEDEAPEEVNEGTETTEATEATEDAVEGEGEADTGRGDSVSAFSNGYSISIQGEYPEDETFQILYICAAACFVLVGIMDAIHQQLGFHIIMVSAGITGIIAGSFILSNEKAFDICHSVSTHFFLLQSALLVYSRLFLTYENKVRRVLNFADALFVTGALMNVVVSYMRFDHTSLAMTKSALAAYVFWVVAAIIYVLITVLFWSQRQRNQRAREKENASGNVTSGDVSVQESCNVMQNNEGFCEVSLLDTDKTEV